VLQFSGTPLDRDHRSRVSIRLPASAAAETWTVSVKADGRVYRDDIDLGSVTPRTAPAALDGTPPPSARAAIGTATADRLPVWPLVLGGVLLAAVLWSLARWSWQARSRRMSERI
jgi:hypothetical protein